MPDAPRERLGMLLPLFMLLRFHNQACSGAAIAGNWAYQALLAQAYLRPVLVGVAAERGRVACRLPLGSDVDEHPRHGLEGRSRRPSRTTLEADDIALTAALPAIPLGLMCAMAVRRGMRWKTRQRPARLRDACLGSLPRAAPSAGAVASTGCRNAGSRARARPMWMRSRPSPTRSIFPACGSSTPRCNGDVPRAPAPMTARLGCCARSTGRFTGSAITPSLRT